MNRGASRFLPGAIALVALCAGCASPPSPSPSPGEREVARASALAQTAFSKGALEDAARLYERAYRQARAMDGATEIGNTAYNLAICRAMLGEERAARDALVEARAELSRAGLNTADTWILEARLARRAGDAASAGEALERAITTAVTPAQHLEAHVLQAELACDRKDLPKAETQLAAVQRLPKQGVPPHIRAGAAQMEGRVELLRNSPASAARAFDRETALHRESGQFAEMAASLERAAGACRQAGEPAKAADRYFRAGRARLADEHPADAEHLAEQALLAAREGADAAMEARILSLLQEIEAKIE